MVPARFSDPSWAAWAGYPSEPILPLLSYMFLHGDWLHLLLNMWMLWIFADNIEDVTGHVRFLVFYVCCGLAAVALHALFNLGSSIPIIGASGAVAGVLGAYFVLYPHGRVSTLIFVVVLPIRAVVFLGIWFVMQVLYGIQDGNGQVSDVAWWAHVGGFLAGMLLIRVFRLKDRCYYCYNPERRYYDLQDRD